MHATLGDYLSELVQNALEAEADAVTVRLDETDGFYRMEVTDNGRGMTAAQVARVTDPFVTAPGKHPGRRVGLGLAFVRQVAEQTGGTWTIDSAPGAGTRVGLTLPRAHWDTPPLGDLPGVWRQLLAGGGGAAVTIERRRGAAGYRVTRGELLEALGELESVGALRLAGEYVRSLEDALEAREGMET
ncbi:MAG: ATP-binding protein [Candidatus Marinimicrobia bacterium]|nr:ATP-binding protein [Candidatus Neomarinimicrobiota bacterium]